MAAEGGSDIVWFTYTGQDEIPFEATHIIVDVRTIPRRGAFCDHSSIVEVICLDRVKKIEYAAFEYCPNLRRVIMPCVEVVEECAFNECTALMDVQCGKLEIIKQHAFTECPILTIDLPSVRIVKARAFDCCTALTDVKFGSKLERIEGATFLGCSSLERITLPLKDGVITADDIFMGCGKLKHVDLMEGVKLQETVAALHFEGWRNDMNEVIDSINRILPNAPAGDFGDNGDGNVGGKARVIRWWIRSVLRRIIHYKAEHQRILNEAAATLQFALPRDIVINNVLPFLALPSHTFEVEDQDMEENDSVHDEGV